MTRGCIVYLCIGLVGGIPSAREETIALYRIFTRLMIAGEWMLNESRNPHLLGNNTGAILFFEKRKLPTTVQFQIRPSHHDLNIISTDWLGVIIK
jgi:hypothetical protein